MSGPATAEKVDPGNREPGPGNRKLKPVPPRTLEDVLKEGRGRCPFRSWSCMVERQVDKEMGNPGVPKERQKARDHVLAQDRSYWM